MLLHHYNRPLAVSKLSDDGTDSRRAGLCSDGSGNGLLLHRRCVCTSWSGEREGVHCFPSPGCTYLLEDLPLSSLHAFQVNESIANRVVARCNCTRVQRQRIGSWSLHSSSRRLSQLRTIA